MFCDCCFTRLTFINSDVVLNIVDTAATVLSASQVHAGIHEGRERVNKAVGKEVGQVHW